MADESSSLTTLTQSSPSDFVRDLLSNPTIVHYVRLVTWAAFDAVKDESIRFTIYRIPISIRISKLEPLIIRLVGHRPVE